MRILKRAMAALCCLLVGLFGVGFLAASSASASPPSDPLAAAQAALARAKPALNCRYAFTLVERGENDTVWASFDLKQSQTLQFDPRRPIGERWRILATTRSDRLYQRRVFNYGGRSDPRTDLLTLTLEGDVAIRDLTLTGETPAAWTFGFRPSASPIVNRMAHPFLNALQGELQIDKASGDVISRRLFLSSTFDAGAGRVRKGDFTRFYERQADGAVVLRAATSKLGVSVYGRQIDSEGDQTIRNIIPICDAAEVQRIAAMEAAAPNIERTDNRPFTGTRIQR